MSSVYDPCDREDRLYCAQMLVSENAIRNADFLPNWSDDFVKNENQSSWVTSLTELFIIAEEVLDER